MFSVVVPVYNKAPHLERSINSILKQSYGEFEVILVDDASTDGSYEKLLTFNDPRIKVFRRSQPGAGGYAARNMAIKNAKYNWISFLDADDEWHPDLLQKVSQMVERFPDASIFTYDWEELKSEKDKKGQSVIDLSLGRTKRFTLKDFLVEPALMWTGAITIKKQTIIEAGMFPANGICKKGGDMDTWIRCLQKSEESVNLEEKLSFYFRDTVNRVTDSVKNPSSHFCAYESLRKIYFETTDRALKKAIENYINMNVYNIQARIIKAGYTIDYKLLAKMHFNGYSISRYLKLHLMRWKNILKQF